MLTYAIGDVHGCLAKLVRLIDHCRLHGEGDTVRFVLLGDYVDRGPDSRGVISLLRKAQAAAPEQVICLRGNHEAMLVDAWRGVNEERWLANGAGPTLASYGVSRVADLPADDLEWISRLPLTYDDGLRFFVHAGIDPSRPLDAQDEHDLIWMREPFLSSTQDFGRLIVHGHTPLRNGRPDVRANRINLDTAAALGGPLSAVAFGDDTRGPLALLSDIEEPRRL